MSISEAFNHLPADQLPVKAPKKRPAPFAIRLSEDERARLTAEAKGAPLGTYIKSKALGGPPLRLRRSGLAIEDRQALAKALALLGRSHIANNLNQLAHAANIGALAMTPETEAELRETLRDVRVMRLLLMSALGFKPEAGP
jgi:xanthine dehydrogenase molybdopterin-binding subunit B